eukprot:CAMPEP_0176477028 /NCGR_PEP_ID=MMETSP0200_2-20121128/388_1 /TAXON_ID=947934 /ORGANISM="Chaetoceros sp., Strain GSL56" /LENGTH=479 /DNA_ID=CAMNT_0017872779 /DNA_START=376 /DNA_END=1812 /DNA_ORIENTATION=-
MMMQGNNIHWTEIFYKELHDVEEYESSFAQAISPPHKNHDVHFLPKTTTSISDVEPKKGGSKVQKVKEEIIQQASLENTINCDFRVDSFPFDQCSIKDSCDETKYGKLDEKRVSETPPFMNQFNRQSVKQGKNSSTTNKIDRETYGKSTPKQKVESLLKNRQKEKLRESFEKESGPKSKEKSTSKKCTTTAMQTSDFSIKSPATAPAPVAIEIFKEKAEYRVISVSNKSSPEKQSKGVAGHLASPKLHQNYHSSSKNRVHQADLCSKSKPIPRPSTPLLGKILSTYDEYSSCSSTCSTAADYADEQLSVSMFSRGGNSNSITSTTAEQPNSVLVLHEDEKGNTITSGNRLQSPAKKTKDETIEYTSCGDQSSSASMLSKPSLNETIECNRHHAKKDEESSSSNVILGIDPHNSSSLFNLLKKSSLHSTARTNELSIPEDYLIENFYDIQHDDATEDDISMALTIELSGAESQRSLILLD